MNDSLVLDAVPEPPPPADHRFTLHLLVDVADVLTRHGYAVGGIVLLELQDALVDLFGGGRR